MPLDQLLLTVLGAAILVNVLLVVGSVAAVRSGRLRRPSRPSHADGRPALGVSPGGPGAANDEPIRTPAPRLRLADREDDGRVAAAVEAFVAGVATEAADSPRRPSPAEVLARHQEVVGGSGAGTAPPGFASGPKPLAGLADAGAWERMVRDESARAARFGRPSSVVTVSLRHLENLAERWGGRETADRVVAQAATMLESECRSIDRVARLGEARFGILLPETSELGASQFAARVRAVADAWFTSAGLSVRLEFSWNSLPGGPVDSVDIGALAGAPTGRG
jgi:diguanylate cyclase (GGDEF)-like protein